MIQICIYTKCINDSCSQPKTRKNGLSFHTWPPQKILFSDKKIFTVEHILNKQNHRILASDKSTLPESTFRISRAQKPASVMVWAGVTSSSQTPLVFIPQRVKITQCVSRETVLEKVLEPWAKSHFGNDIWIFQQDYVPAHKAKATQEWCKIHFADFITADEWPPARRPQSLRLPYMANFGGKG